MLEQASPLKRSMLNSALAGQSRLRPNGNNVRKRLMTSLMLTSLVDAFSILVIFLIVNHASNQDSLEFDNKKLALPQAQQSQVIENGVVIRVDGKTFFIDSKTVTIEQLAQTLEASKSEIDVKKDGLIIIADKKLDFEDLSPVIAVGSQAGFSKFKFVVERKE